MKRDFSKSLEKHFAEQVATATDRLTRLRQIELAKSGEDAPLCPTCGNLDTPTSCTCLQKSVKQRRQKHAEKRKRTSEKHQYLRRRRMSRPTSIPAPDKPPVEPPAPEPTDEKVEERNTTPKGGQPKPYKPPPMYNPQTAGKIVSGLQTVRRGINLANVATVDPERAISAGIDWGIQEGMSAMKRQKTSTPPHPFEKAEDYIDLKHSSDPEKRIKTIGKVGLLPSDRKIEKIDNPGAGGEPTKSEILRKLLSGDKKKEDKKEDLKKSETSREIIQRILFPPVRKDVFDPNKSTAPKAAPPLKTSAPSKQGGTEAPAGMPGVPKPPSAPGSKGATFGKGELAVLAKCALCKGKEHPGKCSG